MTTITWNISQLDCVPQAPEGADYVVTAHWQCMGVDGVYSGQVYSTTGFAVVEGAFTPYADLTQDQVLGWCWANGVDQTAVEASVQSQINSQINPTVIQPPLPWATA